MTAEGTTTLWRSVGPAELRLLEDAEWRAWPPRPASQPIFYPVLNRDYAIHIAREWHARHDGAGFVTEFDVRTEFLDAYEAQEVGDASILAYRIPAEDVDRLNDNLVGRIRLVDRFLPAADA